MTRLLSDEEMIGPGMAPQLLSDEEMATLAPASEFYRLTETLAMQRRLEETPEEASAKAKEIFELTSKTGLNTRTCQDYFSPPQPNPFGWFGIPQFINRAITRGKADLEIGLITPLVGIAQGTAVTEEYWRARLTLEPPKRIAANPNDPFSAMDAYFRYLDKPPSLTEAKMDADWNPDWETRLGEQKAYELWTELKLSKVRSWPGYQKGFDEAVRAKGSMPTFEAHPELFQAPKNTPELLGDLAAGLGAFIVKLAIGKRIFGAIGIPKLFAIPAAWEWAGGVAEAPPGEQAALYGILKIINAIPIKGITGHVLKTLGTMNVFGGLAKAHGASNRDVLIQAFIPAVMNSPTLFKLWSNRLGAARTSTLQREVLMDLAYAKGREVPIAAKKGMAGPEGKIVTAKTLGATYERLVAPFPEIAPEHQTAMTNALAKAKKVLPIVKGEIHEARAKIAGAIRPKIAAQQAEGTPTEKAIQRAIPAGPLAEYVQRFPSVRGEVPPEALEAYWASIPKNPRLTPFGLRNTSDALTKLIDGSYLTLGEAGLLAKHFGRFAPEIAGAAKGRVPFGDKVWQTIAEVMATPRMLLTSAWDVSGISRQGRFLMQRYPELGDKYVEDYLRAFASEKFTQRLVAEYESSPNLERMIRIGKLQVTSLPEFYEGISAVEEPHVAAPLLERIPGVGKYVIRPTVRSYSAALNAYRVGIVDRGISAAERIGKPLTDAQLRTLCSDINAMSGRGEIPAALNRITILFKTLFAPQFTYSRVQMAAKVPKEVGRLGLEVAKGKPITPPNAMMSWASLIGTNALIMNLTKMLHPDAEIEPDLRSTDGGKIKVGTTRIDLWAGELPFMRTAMRLITGQTKTAAGRMVPTDWGRELVNIFRSRFSPMASLLIDAITGRTYIGETFGAPPRGKAGAALTEKGVPKWLQGIGKEAWNRLGPLTMQDFADALIEEGVPAAITAGVMSAIGLGVQTYPEPAGTSLAKFQDRIAREEYEKDWQELSAMQQRDLREKYPEDFEHLELQVRQERFETPRYEYSIEDEMKAGGEVRAALPKEVQEELDLLGISFGLERRVGKDPGWYMPDNWYARYKALTSEAIMERLPERIMEEDWLSMTTTEKTRILTRMIDKAKELARKQVIQEAIEESGRQPEAQP